MQITHYFDYKSPYAYLAQEATARLETDFGVRVDWLPYGLDIPSFLGAGELDARGRDTIGTRTPHQWRRVRYSYMDCRREANRRGLVIRGPQKIFDSSTSHIAMLFAKRLGDFRPYHDRVYERFWRRELDLEDRAAIAALLEEVGVSTDGFREFLDGEGRAEYERILKDAQAKGVFGVPSYLVDGELYWGGERIERIREQLAAAAGQGTVR